MMLPTPKNIQDVRVEAGLTQCQAASMVGLAHAVRWSEIENGRQAMDPARWELFLIKTGRHQLYAPRPEVEIPTLQNSNGQEPMVVPKKHKREIHRKVAARSKDPTQP